MPVLNLTEGTAMNPTLPTLHDSYGRMIDIFDLLPAEDIVRRHNLQQFMNSAQVRQIEAAINREAKAGNADRVEEGMLYFEKLFLRKVNLNALDARNRHNNERSEKL
jgi:hypothetical protein